ncbi:tetratricopeptide repeat protein [Colwellia sp. MEBiC06753]
MKMFVYLLLLGISVLSANLANAGSPISECSTDACQQMFKQYHAAAARGHTGAISILGQFYQAGYGTKPDIDKALFLYKKAARSGDIAANYKAGLFYLSDSQQQDIDKGIRYLEEAAADNFKNAEFLLAIIYVNPNFGPYNLKTADPYLAKLYQERHPDIPAVIDYIEETTKINENTLPQLTSAMTHTPLALNEINQHVWPKEFTEVITITSPPIEQILEQNLMTFRSKSKALGSRLPSAKCENKLGCYSTINMEYLADFTFLRLQ